MQQLYHYYNSKNMFTYCLSTQVIITIVGIWSALSLYEVHGLQCQRAQKDEWANATESWDTSCPYRKGTEERCYFMNCSNGNSYQAEWGCIADFGYAHFQCSASCFNKNGFTCKCILGIEGVDMSNKNMAIIIPAELLKIPCPTTTKASTTTTTTSMTTTSTSTTATFTTTTPSTTTSTVTTAASTATTQTPVVPSTFSATGLQNTEASSSATTRSGCHLEMRIAVFLFVYAISRALFQ